MSSENDREAILAWFAARDGWVPMAEFIAAWEGRLSHGHGRRDLIVLVEQGRLEKFVDWNRMSTPRGGRRSMPFVEYRFVRATP